MPVDPFGQAYGLLDPIPEHPAGFAENRAARSPANQEPSLDSEKEQGIREIVESLMRFQASLVSRLDRYGENMVQIGERLRQIEQAPAAAPPHHYSEQYASLGAMRMPGPNLIGGVGSGLNQPSKTGPSLAGRIGILEERLDQLTSQVIGLSQMVNFRLERIEREVLGD